MPEECGSGSRLVPRTNALLENHFKELKHGERRRSGRKILTCDLEHFPADAVFVNNLKHNDYVQILCGSIEKLPEAFYFLDKNKKRKILQGNYSNEKYNNLENILQLATTSLSTADKRIIRTEEMAARIISASKSRAPKLCA